MRADRAEWVERIQSAFAGRLDRSVVERVVGLLDPGPGRVVIGWATVDVDRAAAAEGSEGKRSVLALPDDPHLGARVFRPAHDVHDGRVLLEPSTEGRLAASLARFGEGPAVAYVATRLDQQALRAAGVRLSTVGPGPFGPQALVLAGDRFGPHLVAVLSPPDTITAVSETGTVTVRPAVPADAEAIAALLTDEGYPAGGSDIVERLERFGSSYSRVLVADLDAEVLGFLAVHVIPRFEHDDRIVRIVALIVDPAARERGVGGRLMAEAERIGNEVEAAFVEVTAGHHRPDARRLYESLGYDAAVTAYLRKRLER
ncbi:MAG TPA: GNAT family N-acetyltransferase [Candidatus Limnocylindrales bacterium]|nr:GNAT family N-acetyltransferase [Candidatus Limnocylindrales bacterium]